VLALDKVSDSGGGLSANKDTSNSIPELVSTKGEASVLVAGNTMSTLGIFCASNSREKFSNFQIFEPITHLTHHLTLTIQSNSITSPPGAAILLLGFLLTLAGEGGGGRFTVLKYGFPSMYVCICTYPL
jgi:hypothetical protein